MRERGRKPGLTAWLAGGAVSASIVVVCLFLALPGRAAPATPVAPAAAPEAKGDAEPGAPSEPPSARDAAVMEIGRRYAALFYGGELRELYEHCTLGFASEMPLDKMRTLRTRVRDQLGGEVELVDERVVPQGEMEIYSRVGRFDHASELVELSLTINPRDLMAGLRIRVGQTRSGEDQP